MKQQRFPIECICIKTTCTIDEAWQSFRALCMKDNDLSQFVDFEDDPAAHCEIVPVALRGVVIEFSYLCDSRLTRDQQYLRAAFRGVEFALMTCEHIAAGHMHDDLKIDSELINGFVKSLRETVLDPMQFDFPDLVF